MQGGLMFSKKSELEKTLDQALSNENWGASGTMLADIAQASYNEYFKPTEDLTI